jgi:hypothetical protein
MKGFKPAGIDFSGDAGFAKHVTEDAFSKGRPAYVAGAYEKDVHRRCSEEIRS